MSSKAARTLVAPGRTAAALPRRPASLVARLLAATVVTALLAPAAAYALDPATTTVVSSAASVLAGTPVTYTVRVTAPTGSPVPTGTVTVNDGATAIGSCPLASGTCQVVATGLSVGVHAITAAYPGDAAHDPSTSVVALQTVTSGIRAARTAATTVSSGQTSLVASAPVGVATGDVLIAAVTVTGGSGTTITATGWNRLTGSDLSSGTLLRQGLYYRVRAAADPSSFTFGFSSAQKATAVIVAVAGADTSAAPRSTGAVFASASAFTLPTIAFASRLTGVALGFLGVGVGTTLSSVANGYTTTASIAASGGKAATQTTSAAAQLALADATAATGARVTMAAAAVGIGHTVVVPFLPVQTLTRIVSAPSAATFGTAGSWSVRVDPTTATGSVAFLVDGTASGTTCTLAAGTCTATLPLAAGQRTVSARYVPTPASLLASTSPDVAISVARATSTTTITALTPTTTRGAVATFRVAVSGGASLAAGSGTVQVLEAGQPVASCTLASGTCDATTATLSVGAHTLSATFDGDTNLEGSTSGAVTQTVTRATSTTTLAVSSATSPYGSPLTLTASVTGGSGAATGTIAFSDGTLPLSTCTLGSGGTPGTCSVSVSSLGMGAHSLVARYGGDADRLESTSATRAVTISKATSAIAIATTPASPTVGSPVAIRASVTTGDGSVATGTVTFTEGTAVLGSCTLGSGGTPGVCSVAVATFSVGDHVVGVAYGGDTVHQASSLVYTQSIGRAATTTTITSTPNPSVYGGAVSFTVTVTSVAGTPTGSISVYDGATPLTTCTLASGVCSFSTSALAVGSHTVAVTYGGDANRAQSSASVLQSVLRANTATTLAVSGTLTYGSPITLTATVDRTAATGSVAFSDGTTPLGSCTLGVGGIAGRCALTTSALAAGTRSIVATYLGDTNFAPSPSTAATPTIARAGTTLTLVKSGGSAYGAIIVFTATLDRTAATGTIAFSDGTAGIGTCTVGTLAPGSCSLSIATLSVGVHSVTASYGGDTSFQPSTSGAVAASITRGTSSTAVTASPTAVLVGDPVTLTVTVSPVSATGLVDIVDGGAWIGQCSLAGGSCSFTTSFATKGTRSIGATYQGDTNLASSAATVVTVGVRSTSTTTLSTDLATSTYGNPVTLTGAVAGADGGTPTGRVAFSDGTTGIGSCDLMGATSCSITVTSLGAGTRSLVARYAGDMDYAASSGTASLPVTEATSATTVATSAATVSALASVTFTVAVTTSDGGLATGLVAVSDGTTPISTCLLATGVCTVATGQLAVGAHTIVATYLGDPNHTGSSGSVAQTVTALPSSVVGSANPASTTWGTPVTLTATVSPSAATGTVTFSESGNLSYGSCSILASSPGTCSLTTSAIAVGTRTITVRYGGDARYAASTATVTVTVARGTSTTTLTTSASTGTTYGSPVTFTATVAPSVATGTVSFSDGTAGIGTCTLAAGSNGICTLSISTLSVGAHAIVARFAGSTNLRESTSGTLTQTVTAAPTTLTITSSANPATVGSGTATISVAPAAAGGVVTITDNGGPFTSCTLVSGTCSIPLAALPLGTHVLLASYPGATNYGPSSGSLTQVVSIGYRAVAAAASGSKTVTSLAVTIPASVTSGDILVAAVTITGTTTIAPGAGWTRLGTDVTGGSVSQGVFWRAVSSGDGGTSTSFGFSTSVKAEVVMIAVGGASATGPVAVAAQSNVAATSIATPALALAAPTRGLALVFGGIATATASSSVGGYTVPVGGEAATSGGQAQTTTIAAYSGASTYGSIAAATIGTTATTGAVSIGHVVFLAQAIP